MSPVTLWLYFFRFAILRLVMWFICTSVQSVCMHIGAFNHQQLLPFSQQSNSASEQHLVMSLPYFLFRREKQLLICTF